MRPQRKCSEESRTQTRRFRAFIDAEVQSQLQLTDDQREQIHAILRAGFQEAKPIRESLTAWQKRTLEKATAVLTDEQKSQWEQMQGQHFEVGQEADHSMSQGGSGVRGGPGMRGQRMGGPGVRGGPGMRRQRMGGPGMGGGPGMRGQRMGGPESARSASIFDSQESDISSEREGSPMNQSLGDFPTNVRIVGVDEFDEASFDELAPLIVKGAVARVSKKWTDDWLLQRFGNGFCQVSLDSRPVLRAFKKHMALGQYLDTLAKSSTSDHPTEYLFHSQRDFEGAADLLEDLDVPAAILGLGDANLYRFFVGPALSGTLPHHHTYGINALARGRKRWAIYVGANRAETEELLHESYRNYESGSQAKEWFARECPKLRSRRKIQLWEFAQEAGDLVYIPAFFIHAVVNLKPVVGFSVELQAQDFAPGPMRARGTMRARVPIRSGPWIPR